MGLKLSDDTHCMTSISSTTVFKTVKQTASVSLPLLNMGNQIIMTPSLSLPPLNSALSLNWCLRKSSVTQTFNKHEDLSNEL